MSELTGGLTNYYLVPVLHPQREEQEPYQAECEDIAEALQLTPNEFCEFKAIWRTAAARLGNGKPGNKALYDAQKRVHYATRDLVKLQREATREKVEKLKEAIKAESPDGWVAHTGNSIPVGLDPDAAIQVRLVNGAIPDKTFRAKNWNWESVNASLTAIEAWRFA